MKPSNILGALFFILSQSVFGQLSFEHLNKSFKSDYTVKEVFADGAIGLTKGSIIYTTLPKSLKYVNTFPSSETIVIQDSTIKVFVGGELLDSRPYPNLLEFSVFHLIVTSKLDDFGLRDTPFKIVETKMDGGVLLTRWEVPFKTRSPLKAFELAVKNGQLQGIISYGEEDAIISKQVFSDYTVIDGYQVPTKSMEIKYNTEGMHKKMMTFSNIRLNE